MKNKKTFTITSRQAVVGGGLILGSVLTLITSIFGFLIKDIKEGGKFILSTTEIIAEVSKQFEENQQNQDNVVEEQNGVQQKDQVSVDQMYDELSRARKQK